MKKKVCYTNQHHSLPVSDGRYFKATWTEVELERSFAS